jgi:hypothetical protein
MMNICIILLILNQHILKHEKNEILFKKNLFNEMNL